MFSLLVLLQSNQATQQLADTLVQAVAPTSTQAPPPELSLWYLLKEGGPLMIPLLLCSIVGIYIFVVKYIEIKRCGGGNENMVSHIKPMIQRGQIDTAQNYLHQYDSSVARMLEKGVSRIGKPYDVIENSMESVAERELYNMDNRVSILATIADIAPMFGFLGTIAGMIILFYNVNTHGFSLESISSGIYTKMITSAVGLIIGILAYMGFKFLNSMIDKNVNKMEIQASDFIDCLYEPIS